MVAGGMQFSRRRRHPPAYIWAAENGKPRKILFCGGMKIEGLPSEKGGMPLSVKAASISLAGRLLKA